MMKKNNIYLCFSNPLMDNIVEENKDIYNVSNKFTKETNSPYFKGLENDLNINIKIIYDLNNENTNITLTALFNLLNGANKLNSKQLFIRIYDIMLLNSENIDFNNPALYYKFIEFNTKKEIK